jgi:[protein-PII] uridylyltransferase
LLIPSTAAATAEIKFDDLIRDLERADDSTVAYKSALEKGEDRIRQHYTGNESAWQAIVARSALVDSILIQCWSTLVGGQHFSLLAVGGYGRGELHPYSDVDLMILVDKKIESRFETAIGEFVARLWDIGLDIGHSVRTINECIVESRLDVTVITNLMESRRLAGAAALYRQMLSEIQPEKIWPADEFFRAKREEQRRRHIRFQDTSYRLEPNVKESPGGIRDIQTIRWIAQRYFNTSDFQALVEQGFLAPEELTTLRQGEDLLCKIRFLLHNTAGRREDRLLFDYQRDLAHAFGYTVDEKNHCIEQFMQGYYRTVMALERLNEMLLQLFDEGLPGKQTNKPIVPLNDRFQINNQHIEVVDENVFAVHPPALLELFLLSAQNPQIDGVRANTIRLVRSHLYLIDDDFRDNPISRGLFMEILRQPQGITHQLRRMNRYGVLAAYLPTFESIVGRMQYDLFHIFTVDEHILMVIRNMRRFAIDKHRDEVPQCNYVMESIEKPELLFLMGLFHDIAKGRGGNHSELGATEAHDFCIEHGLSAVDASLVQWAVANHLIMSMTVQRRDVSDPEEIYSFAQRVSSKTHLDYLYLLTVADIRGTDPALWNSWKDSLLKTLYHGTLKVLNRGLENPLNKAEIIAENKTRALTLLTDCSVDKTEIFRHWNNLGDIYFLRYSADEISWHTAEIIKHNNDNVPLVSIRQDTRYGSTEIFIYCADQDHLFAQITTVIGRLELNIISARIMTSTTGYALDRFRVLDKSGRPVTEKTQLRQIRIDLESALCQPKLLPPIDARQQSRRLKHFHIPVSVEFDNEVTAGLTSVTVNATDISGALSLIARGFLVCDLSVHAAKVATIGEKIDDVFFISHRDNRPVTDPAQLDKLEQILIEQLSA